MSAFIESFQLEPTAQSSFQIALKHVHFYLHTSPGGSHLLWTAHRLIIHSDRSTGYCQTHQLWSISLLCSHILLHDVYSPPSLIRSHQTPSVTFAAHPGPPSPLNDVYSLPHPYRIPLVAITANLQSLPCTTHLPHTLDTFRACPSQPTAIIPCQSDPHLFGPHSLPHHHM